MKTNAAARRVWKLRLSLVCLAIAALASFDLWAGGYCLRNLAQTSMQHSGAPQVWAGSVTGSEVFLAVR
jgi:hypothetical protein